MYRINPRYIHVILITSLLLAACASSSFFYTYDHQVAAYHKAIHQNTPSLMAKKITHKISSADGMLYAQEAGRLQQLAGQFKQSELSLREAIRHYKKADTRAIISTSKTSAQALSLLGNENNIPYDGAPFERVYTHHFQAYNYLFTQNMTAAGVEIRRARDTQRRQELLHDKHIAKAHQKAREQQINLDLINKNPLLTGVDLYTSKIRSHFLSAYTYYFSAVFAEANQQWNNARVDYKKAYEINPDNRLIQNAIKRVEKQQTQNNKGVLVVLFEQGFIAKRKSLTLSIPSPSLNTFLSISLPYYAKGEWPETKTLQVSVANQTQTTDVLTSLSALAAKSLKNNYPTLLTRQVLRVIAKKQLQAKMQKSSDVGGVLANIYSIASEQADLRSWSTLPHSAQATRFEISHGLQEIFIDFGYVSKSQHILIHKGQTTLLRVIDAGNRLVTQITQL